MSKTLLVSGDSYTVANLHPTSGKPWANYIGNEMEWKVKNYARSGASNEFIFNSIIDAIEGNKEEDIVVCVMWSEPFRIGLHDNTCQILNSEEMLTRQSVANDDDHVNSYYIELTSEFTRIANEILMGSDSFMLSNNHGTAYKKCVNHSLRYMFLLEEYCRFNNIKLYHWSSLNVFASPASLAVYSYACGHISNQQQEDIFEKSVDEIKETNQYYKYLAESPNYLGFNFDGWDFIQKRPEWKISDRDHHPNSIGHEELSKVMCKFIKDGIKPTTRNEYSRPIYIYD